MNLPALSYTCADAHGHTWYVYYSCRANPAVVKYDVLNDSH